MKIESITLSNWMAFRGEQRLVDLPAAPIALVGRYIENRRRSNWSGKTALLEAITFALFGVHRKRLADGVIHRGTDEAFVTVTLTDGIVIRRARKRGGPTSLSVKIGPDITTGDAAEQRIADVFGMSHGDFVATQCFQQGDTESIIGREAGERRRVVMRWLELDRWERMAARARTVSNAASQRVRALAAVAPADAAPVDLDALKAEREQLRKRSDEIERERAQWQREDARWREASKDEGAERDLRAAAEELQGLRDVHANDAPDMSGLETRVADLRAARDIAAKEVDDSKKLLAGGFDSVCPVVRKPCPSATWVSQQGAAARERHERSLPILCDADANYGGARDELAAAQRHRDEHARRAGRADTIKKRMQELRARVDARKARLAELTLDGPAITAGLERATREAMEVRTRFADVNATIERVEGETKRAASLAADKEAATRAARISLLVTKAVAPSGIPARIAAAQLRGLEERANVLLDGTGLSFELGWERETKEPTPTCEECGYMFKGKKDKACPACSAPRGMKRSDELEILVEDGSGEIEDVRAKSGGAKVLVASAIRLAGGAMLRDLRGSPVRFALVDEPFGPLDAENREGLARSFAGMIGSVGLEQAFVVSHDAQLLDALPARIVVTRDRGFSTLTMET